MLSSDTSPPGEEEVVKYLLECRADVRLGIVFRLGWFFGWDWHLFKLKLQVFIRIEAWIKLKKHIEGSGWIWRRSK